MDLYSVLLLASCQHLVCSHIARRESRAWGFKGFVTRCLVSASLFYYSVVMPSLWQTHTSVFDFWQKDN